MLFTSSLYLLPTGSYFPLLPEIRNAVKMEISVQ